MLWNVHRCIGEKMARAMILSFLAKALPEIDAEAPADLPEDGFFDLIPASELRLHAGFGLGAHRSPGWRLGLVAACEAAQACTY